MTMTASHAARSRLVCEGHHAVEPGRGASIAPRAMSLPWRAAALAWQATALWLATGTSPALAQPAAIDVRVEKRGEMVVVDVDVVVPTEPRFAWAVLTDYDHMAGYVSVLKSSKVLKRDGNHWQVEQMGEAKRAFLKFNFYSLRAVELVSGREIKSHLISGDFKSYQFATTVKAQGAQTQITHHGEYVPLTWVPPGVGPALIRAETHKQFEEMIAEMVSRSRSGVTSVSPATAASAAARQASAE